MQHRIAQKAFSPLSNTGTCRRTAYKVSTAAMATSDKTYKLSGNTSLALQQGDLTKVKVDAIVNAGLPRATRSRKIAVLLDVRT